MTPHGIAICRGCNERFKGRTAFDRHQFDDGRTPACREDWKGTRLDWSDEHNAWRQKQ